MGVEVRAVNLARRIALFNSEVIFYVKNSLMVNTPKIQKRLDVEYEKFSMLVKDGFGDVRISTLLANTGNNDNHDLLKLDIDLIAESLLEKEGDDGGGVCGD